MEKKLSKKALLKSFHNWYYGHLTCFSQEHMQTFGYLCSMLPLVEELYDNEDDKATAMNTYTAFFNTEPQLGSVVVGITAGLEESRANGAEDVDEETINGLSEISRDTCETYITDAKWEEGWKKIATGAFALMSGAGALGVAICEAGTLLTVLGFASGGSSLLFGTSELFEGTQDVSISVQGLKYTDAINPLKDLMGEESYNKALAISTTTADVVCLAGAVKNTVKGIRDAKAAKGMPEEVPTEVPKIEEPNLAEIEKQADLEGEFYEDIFESQRADIPEYEDYLSDFAEAQNDYVKPAGGKSGTTTKPNQVHHFASNKSKKYTSQFESITKKYGLDLDGDWNKQSMPHQGRHPYAYHDYVLDNMQKFDRIANGDKTKFLKLYDQMKQKIINNPEMLYKDYWKK